MGEEARHPGDETLVVASDESADSAHRRLYPASPVRSARWERLGQGKPPHALVRGLSQGRP
jgi:hypothetical protein